MGTNRQKNGAMHHRRNDYITVEEAINLVNTGLKRHIERDHSAQLLERAWAWTILAGGKVYNTVRFWRARRRYRRAGT